MSKFHFSVVNPLHQFFVSQHLFTHHTYNDEISMSFFFVNRHGFVLIWSFCFCVYFGVFFITDCIIDNIIFYQSAIFAERLVRMHGLFVF